MNDIDRKTWETEPCSKHDMTCCGDCLEQAKMKRSDDGDLRYQKDCAVQTFAEITGVGYDAAAEIMLASGFRPGVGTMGRDLRSAFEQTGCTVTNVTWMGPEGAVVASMEEGRKFYVHGTKGKRAHAWSITDGNENRPYFPPYRYRVFEVKGF